MIILWLGSVYAKLAVCFHGLFQDALLYIWRGSSLHYGKPMSGVIFSFFPEALFFLPLSSQEVSCQDFRALHKPTILL